MISSYCVTLIGFLFNLSKKKVDDLIKVKNRNLSSSDKIYQDLSIGCLAFAEVYIYKNVVNDKLGTYICLYSVYT